MSSFSNLNVGEMGLRLKKVTIFTIPPIEGVFHIIDSLPMSRSLRPRLTPTEVLEEVRQITPNCSPDKSSKGAVLFSNMCESGAVLLKWPDGVAVLSFTSQIPSELVFVMYSIARDALEAKVANIKMGE